MASPVVQAYGGSTANSSPLTVTLPGTPADGDLYLIFLANAVDGSWSESSSYGWAELFDTGGIAVYYKQCSSAENNPSFAWTGGGRAVWEAYRITGAIDPSTQPPEASSGASGSSQYPDPDSISPTGGSKDYLFVAFGQCDGNPAFQTGPTAYSNFVAYNAGGGSCGAAIASLEKTGSSEDPGTFALNNSTTWLARTIAVHPSTGTTHYGSATLSGTGTLAAAAEKTATGKATLSGTGSLAGAGAATRLAATTPSGEGTLAAAATRIRTGTATTSGTGTLAAAGQRTTHGAASISGTGSLVAAAAYTAAGRATLSATGSLAGAAHRIRSAAATLSGAGELAAIGQKISGAVKTGSATLYGSGAMSAAAVYIAAASAALLGTGALAAAAIVYTISPTLLAAQKALHRTPYVEAKVYDYERGIKRLAWTRIYTGSEADNHHSIAFDGEGSMHRIRADTGDKLYHQKIANPGPISDYSSWTEIASDCAGPCAIAAYGAKIYIFYRKTDNTLRKHYSHNHGSNWTNAQLASYSDVVSMAAAWWGSSAMVVCFALKSGTPGEINGITLDTSDQTTTPHTWDDGNHPWLATYGLGATYNPAGPDIELVIACKESDSPYNHYDLHRTKFTNLYSFLAIESFLMAPDGEAVTFEYPDCHLPANAQEYETTRVLAVENYTGVTAYIRPITSHLVKGTSWSDTTFVEPRPFMDISPAYGLRMQSTSSHWWISMPAGIWAAPRPAADPLDISNDIVSLNLKQSLSHLQSPLIITLDNSKGQYAQPNLLNKLNKRSELVLRLGYRTTVGAESVAAGTYWIDSWEYSHGPNYSLFTITALDGWGLVDRWTARYQMRWNKDEVDPTTVWQILYQVLARVGIRLTNNPPKPRSSPIDNFYPDFTINPGTPGDTAARRLLSFVPDQLVFRGQEAFTKNPLANEASCYSYSTNPTNPTNSHLILTGRYAENVIPSHSRALGAETDGDRIVEDALDWDALDLAIDILDQDYDPNLETATRAQERADAIARKHALRAQGGQMTVPTNVSQELLDVITATDPRCGIDDKKCRVLAIRTAYDCRNARYDQALTLGAP